MPYSRQVWPTNDVFAAAPLPSRARLVTALQEFDTHLQRLVTYCAQPIVF
jgi:hypothetical protein